MIPANPLVHTNAMAVNTSTTAGMISTTSEAIFTS